ncbi:MAG: nuclear transport factor 2 family protein [Microthrixaceae bacterium]
MSDDEDLRRRRTQVVLDHMRSENEHRFDDTIATFAHPRYELVASGEVYDGEEAVREYYRTSRALVPDQSNELISMYHSDDGVGIEMWLRGTPRHGDQDGTTPFEIRLAAFFEFADDRIVCERVYWDRRSVAEQVRGVADPSSR